MICVDMILSWSDKFFLNIFLCHYPVLHFWAQGPWFWKFNRQFKIPHGSALMCPCSGLLSSVLSIV